MPKTTFICTAPDGTEFTRTSQNRTYPYAVIAGPADREALAKVADAAAAEYDRLGDVLDAALVEPVVKVRQRWANRYATPDDPDLGYRGEHSYHNYEVYLVGVDYRRDGVSVDDHCDSKGVVEHAYYSNPDLAWADLPTGDGRTEILAKATAMRDSMRRDAQRARERAAGLRDGSVALSEYEASTLCLRWTSRLDLAQSYLDSEFGTYAAQGRDLTIVETTVKAPKVRASK